MLSSSSTEIFQRYRSKIDRVFKIMNYFQLWLLLQDSIRRQFGYSSSMLGMLTVQRVCTCRRVGQSFNMDFPSLPTFRALQPTPPHLPFLGQKNACTQSLAVACIDEEHHTNSA